MCERLNKPITKADYFIILFVELIEELIEKKQINIKQLPEGINVLSAIGYYFSVYSEVSALYDLIESLDFIKQIKYNDMFIDISGLVYNSIELCSLSLRLGKSTNSELKPLDYLIWRKENPEVHNNVLDRLSRLFK
ncbi:hypothetical protein ACFFHT_10345 [Gallibacterium melopsittaci]|uniref:Uncharacterized protein n=1 Tax=Gallibacterium melopsittaci TaxID=516063 RepID=A0ABV6HYK1_9PAST